MTSPRVVEAVTCLGCGCACDDLSVRVADGRIVDISPSCPVARAWFGDGTVSTSVMVNGKDSTFEEAIAAAGETLAGAVGRGLVYLGPDVSTQTHRTALTIADLLCARVDTATSTSAATGLLAGQRRGRAVATLGEVRNRADVILFWGVDPSARYPRFASRFIDAAGTHVPAGRAGRRVVSVSIAADRGPTGSDLEVALTPGDEIAALSVMRATVLGNAIGELPPGLQSAVQAARLLMEAKYAVIVHEAEPAKERADPLRAEGLIALTQALNGPTRAALSSLRSGGNRNGAEAVLTWQTGFPMAVDYSRGFPWYAPESRGLERVGDVAAALVVGSPIGIPDSSAAALGSVATVAIGPGASQAPFSPRVAIDTGIAGIHEGGTAYRMDDVPLPLRPPLGGVRSAAETLGALLSALHRRGSRR